MPIGLYRIDNGDVCVEHSDGARLPMPRHAYVSAAIDPAYDDLMSKLDFDQWVLGRHRGEPLRVSGTWHSGLAARA